MQPNTVRRTSFIIFQYVITNRIFLDEKRTTKIIYIRIGEKQRAMVIIKERKKKIYY